MALPTDCETAEAKNRARRMRRAPPLRGGAKSKQHTCARPYRCGHTDVGVKRKLGSRTAALFE